MEAPNSFTELITKFINNETNIVDSSMPNKKPMSPSTETSMVPNQAETFYQAQLGFFKMADSKSASIAGNRYYFKLIRTMFSMYLPKTTVHLTSTYTQGTGFFDAEWVFRFVNGKMLITATKKSPGSTPIVINTADYE